MKRIWVAIGIFVFVGIICTLEIFYVEKSTDKLKDMLSDSQEAAEVEDMEKALEISKKANETWDDKHKILAMFLPHSSLNIIDESFDIMYVNLENGQEEDFFVENTRAQSQLEHLKDSYFIGIHNIF